MKAYCIYRWNVSASEQWNITQQETCWNQHYSITQIAKTNITANNVANVTQKIRSVTNETKSLNTILVQSISTILDGIANVEVEELGQQTLDAFYDTVSNVLNVNETVLAASQEQYNSSNRIIVAVEVFTEKFLLPAEGQSKNISLQNIAIHSLSIKKGRTIMLTAVAAQSAKYLPVREKIPEDTESFIMSLTLPNNLFKDTNESYTIVLFILYRKTGFFKKIGTVDGKKQIRNYVIAVSVVGKSFSNLDPAVVTRYPVLKQSHDYKRSCVFWDYKDGDWSTVGCVFKSNTNFEECHCNHLTNFAMLLDPNPEKTKHMKTLSIISYIGCSMSLLGTILTILTMFIFKKLLANTNSKIFLNICIALAAALSVFLVAAERKKAFSDMQCTVAGILNHYFFLVALAWMVLEAYTMYLSFVKVLPKASREALIPRIWICCLICYGIPAAIVSATASLALESYTFEEYCLLHGLPMIAAFFIPVAVCVLGNTIIYFLILRSLLRSGSKVPSTKRTTGIEQARRGGAISVVLGLTWISGVLAIGDAKLPFQYIFCIINSLQGLMIFLFYCVFSTEVRVTFRNKFNKKISSESNGDSSFGETETKMKEIRKVISTQYDDETLWQNTCADNVGFSAE